MKTYYWYKACQNVLFLKEREQMKKKTINQGNNLRTDFRSFSGNEMKLLIFKSIQNKKPIEIQVSVWN